VKISEFISESLSEIVIGIQTAKHNVAKIGAIAPGTADKEKVDHVEFVEFEIAVTVAETDSEENQKKAHLSGGGGIVVVKATLNAEKTKAETTTKSDEKTSRLKFRVPVHLNRHFRQDLIDNPSVWKDDKDALDSTLEVLNKT